VKATSADHRIVDYRRRLKTALEALAPEEAADLVEEVESHLAEAADEGRLEGYLGEIGSPESFAAGILAERGLLPDPDLVPEAPTWRRLLAGLIDAIVALAPFVVGLLLHGDCRRTQVC
jgi:uncharacterized membrane protein